MSNNIEERMYRKGIAKAPISLANLRRINAAKQSYVNNHFNMYGELPPRNAYGFLPPIQETGQPGSYAFPLTAANRAKVLPRAEAYVPPTLPNYAPPPVPPSSPVRVESTQTRKRAREENNAPLPVPMRPPAEKRARKTTPASSDLFEPRPQRKRGGKSRRRNRNRTHKK